MNTRIQVGMAGVGGYGAVRRATMRATGAFELVAAYDASPEALAVTQREDGARPVNSYTDLLDVAGLQAVIISTGARSHAEFMLAAMERGLAVFVEKPLCATPEELANLIAAQRKTKVPVAVGHADLRHEAVACTTRRLIDEGTLGRVACVEATTSHTGGLLMKPDDWRADPDKNPGGMLFQCGVHKLHELMYYFGPIARVSARMRYDVHTSRTADVAICHLEFNNGVIGCLNAYHVVPYCHRLNIFGTGANLFRDDRYFDEGTALRIQRNDPSHPEAKQPLEDVQLDAGGDGLATMREFASAIRAGGGDVYPSLQDGALAVAAVLAAEESSKTGTVVQVKNQPSESAQPCG